MYTRLPWIVITPADSLPKTTARRFPAGLYSIYTIVTQS